MNDGRILPESYFDEPSPNPTRMVWPRHGIIMLAAVILAVAGAIYIGEFVWSFKGSADQVEIARSDESKHVIHNELAQLRQPADRLSDLED